jgi:hypothetical protein
MGVRVREKDGCWYVFINHKTRRKAHKVAPGPEGYKLASLVADRIRVRLTYGEDIEAPSSVPYFHEYARDWLRQVDVTKKAGTAETYERHMRRV